MKALFFRAMKIVFYPRKSYGFFKAFIEIFEVEFQLIHGIRGECCTSLKKYMAIDLIILTVIGCAVEFLGIFVFNKMLIAKAIPTAISLLIMMVATFRWGWKGLLVSPFLALATILSGYLINPHVDYRQNYDWKLYLAILAQLLSFAINLLWFKKVKDEQATIKKLQSLFALCALDCIVSLLALTFVYFIISLNLLIIDFAAWSAFAYVLLFVGAFILSRQGILVNVKKNLQNQRIEKEEAENFKLNLPDEKEENLEEKKGDF